MGIYKREGVRVREREREREREKEKRKIMFIVADIGSVLYEKREFHWKQNK